MKKIYIPGIAIIILASLMSSLTSCKKGGFLAPTSVTDLTQQKVFVDSNNTSQFLNNIYSSIGFAEAVNRFGNGGLDASCDEGQVGNTSASVAEYWATGTIDAALVSDDCYSICYNKIRAVNQLLANISKTRLNLPGTAPELAGEAKFLRAWYYAELVKHYGGVPLIGDKIYSYNDQIPVIRNSYSRCVQYISDQCDSAYKLLPIVQNGTFYGRADGAACLALKARVLLYAASPLFNDDNSISGPTPHSVASGGGKVDTLVGYTSYDKSRWTVALNATYAFLVQTNGLLKLNVDNKTAPGYGLRALFSVRSNPEYILQRMVDPVDYGNQLETYWDPPSRGGNNGAKPYQEIVDAFPMKDGKDITDPTSAYTYDPQNPYANRDPRLDNTVIRDQTVLPVRLGSSNRGPVNIYLFPVNGTLTGGQDAVTIGTSTGYYVNKMLDTNATSTDITRTAKRCQPLIRYAEMVLNFAECLNETGQTALAGNYVDSIRYRAGIDPGTDGKYGVPAGAFGDVQQMRAVIQHERQLELAFEGHRFWDVRRWKIAPQTEGLIMHGMEVVRNAGTVTFTKFVINPKHNFVTANYLWPFPLVEVEKFTSLVQNPGYF